MSHVISTSKVHIERAGCPPIVNKLPWEPHPVASSVHGAIAEHYPVAIPLSHGITSPRRKLPLTRLSARLLPAIIFFSACAIASAQQAIKTGPEVGSKVPSFEAPDQNGRQQNLQSILGPKGALLVFYRSADW